MSVSVCIPNFKLSFLLSVHQFPPSNSQLVIFSSTQLQFFLLPLHFFRLFLFLLFLSPPLSFHSTLFHCPKTKLKNSKRYYIFFFPSVQFLLLVAATCVYVVIAKKCFKVNLVSNVSRPLTIYVIFICEASFEFMSESKSSSPHGALCSPPIISHCLEYCIYEFWMI